MTVVFVCGGNTCRSPMAAALAEQAWKIPVASAGVDPGGPIAANAVEAVQLLAGVDISDHVAQGLSELHLRPDDVVVALDLRVAEEVLRTAPAGTPVIVRPVPDPYGGTLDNYLQAADQLADLVERLGRTLVLTGAQSPPPGEDASSSTPQNLREDVIGRRRRLSNIEGLSHVHGLAMTPLTRYEALLKRLLEVLLQDAPAEVVDAAVPPEKRARALSQGDVVAALGSLRKRTPGLSDRLAKSVLHDMNALTTARNRLAHEASATLRADVADALELLERVLRSPVWDAWCPAEGDAAHAEARGSGIL